MPYKDPAAQREYQRRWAAKRRAAFFKEKACDWCGSCERLELHHRDPNKKVTHNIWSWGDKRRATEIGKCVVICHACHVTAHMQARRIEAELRHPHGTRPRYDLGCRCDVCRMAKRDYNRKHPPKRAA